MLANGDIALNTDAASTSAQLTLSNQQGTLQSGSTLAINTQSINNQGGTIKSQKTLSLTAAQDYTHRAGDTLTLTSDDLIENNASFIEAEGDVSITARQLNNLRDGLDIQREAEVENYKKHLYNFYWRSFETQAHKNPTAMATTTQQLTFQNDQAALDNKYGTILDIDAKNKRAQMKVKQQDGQVTTLWVNYLALTPNSDGSYAMTFYESRGVPGRIKTPPTPYHGAVWRVHNRYQYEVWNPNQHIDVATATGIDDFSWIRERSVTGSVTRDKLISEGIGARILSGGNMTLNITDLLKNDASTITSTGDLDIKGKGRIENTGYSVNERRKEFYVDHYDASKSHWYPESSNDKTTALTTIDGIISSNGNVSITSANITNTTVNAAQITALEAAMNAAKAERAEWERNPLAFDIDGVNKQDLNTTVAEQGKSELNQAEGTSPIDRPLLPAELALTEKQHIGDVATSIPDNGLFRPNLTPDSPFLVVTDPRFTDRNKFISSDYLLERVGYSPADVHKRLGDGFYEQRLVREQVLKLTGRPSLREEDAMAQYQYLMNNGIKVAEEFNFRPGVALTPAQIAALQQDIVWLVSETINTPQGPQTVWVPKVYLANTTLSLTQQGAMISDKTLNLSADSIDNAGNLLAEKGLKVDAKQFMHRDGDIKADTINIQADNLTLSTNLQDALRQATMSATDITLSGHDVQLQGAKLDATGDIKLNARDNLSITAVKSTHTGSIDVIAGAMGERGNEGMDATGSIAHINGEWQLAQSSELSAGGNLSLNAGKDITVTGSTIHSEKGEITLNAKQNVTLNTATEENKKTVEEQRSSKGFLSASSEHTIQNDETTREKGSLLSGEKVTINAGNDLTVKGSSVVAENDVSLTAGNNVDITAATETDSHYLLEEKKKSGLMSSGGIGFSVGKQSSRHEVDEKGTTQSQSVSTIGSTQGNVNITAGNKLHVGGADLIAQKDLNLSGDSVQIDPGYDERTRTETFETKQSGFGISLSGSAGNALNTAVSTAQQARKESDGRLSTLQNTKAVLSGVQAQQAYELDGLKTDATNAHNLANNLKPGDDGYQKGATNTVGVSVSYGSQSSKSETHTDSRQSQGSTLNAGQNLSITATGKNKDTNPDSGNITIVGSELKAGKDLSLSATQDINLVSAQNTEQTNSKIAAKAAVSGLV